jgi:hypothetical protein
MAPHLKDIISIGGAGGDGEPLVKDHVIMPAWVCQLKAWKTLRAKSRRQQLQKTDSCGWSASFARRTMDIAGLWRQLILHHIRRLASIAKDNSSHGMGMYLCERTYHISQAKNDVSRINMTVHLRKAMTACSVTGVDGEEGGGGAVK